KLYWKRLIPESNVHSAWIFQRERESNFSCPKTCQVFFGLFLKGVSSYQKKSQEFRMTISS
ncbi:MAG: hypothetical protein Q8K59_08325, partial [Nitrosomonas sp.]|nr:hypothetical protein [Nitrosomonas sp.]